MFTTYLNKGKSKGKPSNVKEYRLAQIILMLDFLEILSSIAIAI